MHIFHEHKLIYIAVPATASSSFWHAMQTRWTKFETVNPPRDHPAKLLHPDIGINTHLTAEQGKMFIDPEIWNNYKKIAFVRHPYAWAKSMYNKKGLQQAVGVNVSQDNFVDFLKDINKTPYFWYVDKEGNMLIDKLYRTEDFKQVVAEFDLKELTMNRARIDRPSERTPEVNMVLETKFARELSHYPEEKHD